MDGIQSSVAMEDANVTTPSNTIAYDCNSYEKQDYDVPFAILTVTMGLFGLVYTFVGYRCFKAVMFLSGLIFGGITVYLICQKDGIINHNLSMGAITGIAIGIAILCGLITMLVVYIGLFLQGIFLGALLGIGVILVLARFYHLSSPWIPIGIIFGMGIIFALLTLKWQKEFLIIGTSVMGAALICSCVQYFLGKFSLYRYIWLSLTMMHPEGACWFFTVILCVWPTLAVIGILVQWKFTGKGYDHTDVIIRHGHRSGIRTHLVRQPCESPSFHVFTHHGRRRSGSRLHHQQQESRSAEQNPALSRHSNVENTAADFDALPPSYNDCVKHGAGKPVSPSDQNRIIRTKHGSFLVPAGGDGRDRPPVCSSDRAVSHRRQRDGDAPSNIVHGRHRRQRRSADQRSGRGRGQNRGGQHSSRNETARGVSAAQSRVSDDMARVSGNRGTDDRERLLLDRRPAAERTS